MLDDVMIRSERIIQIDANANAKGGMDCITTPIAFSAQELLYLEACGDNTKVVFRSGESVLIAHPFEDFVKCLEEIQKFWQS